MWWNKQQSVKIKKKNKCDDHQALESSLMKINSKM